MKISNFPNKFIRCLAAALLGPFLLVSAAFGQGQDSTPADRDIMILAELLPGHYRNANQAYFDVRLKQPENERHKSVYTVISDTESFGNNLSFTSENGDTSEGAELSYYLHTLEVDYDSAAVRMKNYALSKAPGKKVRKKSARYLQGCDLLWRQEAGQFVAQGDSNSCAEQGFATQLQLTEQALWMQPGGSELRPFALDRARPFECYADVPGVGGGRDIPFERYELKGMHDLGSEKWFTTKDGQEVGISLFRVMWTFNNYQGVFTRPSFVVYAKTKDEEGKSKEVGYAWTTPDAERIGINLKWMLANCYMLSNEDVTPFFKNNEPTLHK